jgi:hypothetical protein
VTFCAFVNMTCFAGFEDERSCLVSLRARVLKGVSSLPLGRSRCNIPSYISFDLHRFKSVRWSAHALLQQVKANNNGAHFQNGGPGFI